jgi:DNA-binding CsgD family transcriptional regulator
MKNIDDFFIPENTVDYVSEEEYAQAVYLLNALEAFARVSYQSIYVVDYYKKNFMYVSDNPLFLCGLQPDEVKEMGFAFYFNHIPENEVNMLLAINQAGFTFFSQTPVEDRGKLSISYDFHILNRKENRKILINHKLTPILLAKNGNIWLASCVVSLSSRKSAGNIEARMLGEPDYWTYSIDSRKWRKTGSIKLNDREKDILSLSAQGCKMSEIANKLFVSEDTVKFHKRNIFEKLDVKNIAEALSVVSHYKIL